MQNKTLSIYIIYVNLKHSNMFIGIYMYAKVYLKNLLQNAYLNDGTGGLGGGGQLGKEPRR